MAKKRKTKPSPKNPLDASWLLEEADKRDQREARAARITARNARIASKVVNDLVRTDADWEQIFKALNPRKDEKIQTLLLRFRGPHMFAPHVALNILQHCLESNPNLDLNGLVSAAVDESGKVTKFRS
ncbi:hypothetical protein O5O45_08865 [Hahella aquimaris]|uniref:hypothetical protein n=1 Tax=Hahella sp. HNIBRBA332 TaxID=3015983 RepID=UPI00273BA0CE|nr:hypothetical protein [Hahella sp. HNIBRBA332]WLQ16023.1 hypothetical protein O5O45_08865 [Hahella sp. HNIBRBA332]